MIKNLVVFGIPKERKALDKVLMYLGDYTWSSDGKDEWVESASNCIWYSPTYETYMCGNSCEVANHRYENYTDIIK